MSDSTSDSSETLFLDNAEEHRFELWKGDVRVGLIDYSIKDDVIRLPHTEVDPAYGGEGHGKALARGALDAARDAGLKVKPVCPFIAAFIEKNPDYADLVAD